MEQADGTSTPNNTSSGSASTKNAYTQNKKRNYFITFWINNYPTTFPNNVQYCITCEDETEDGKFHGHAFIYFKNPVAMKSVKKLFGNDAHCKKIFNNSGCIQYVKGEIGDERKVKHNIHEYGTPPMDNGKHKTVAELKQIDDPAELDWRMYNTWEKIHSKKKVKIADWHKKIKVYFITGPSGIGKSQTASSLVQQLGYDEIEEVKYVNGFWTGVIDGTGCAIYDDFRDSHMPASEFINFIDYNKHNLNIKGASVKNNYELIIITSIQHPTLIYKNMNDEASKQWLRRIEIIDLSERKPLNIDLSC